MNVDQTHHHTVLTTQKDYRSNTKPVNADAVKVKELQRDNTQLELDIDHKKVQLTVEKLNQFNDSERTNLKFVYHEDLHEYYVTVINPVTDEVIREIPPKKMLDMFAAMEEYMGLLIDEKL